MKRLFYIASAFMLFSLFSCEEKKEPPVKIVPIEELPAIVEAHGTIGDGSSMNVLEFISDDGDTTYLSMNNQSVTGGENTGDEVQVLYYVTDEDNYAHIAVNLTSLQHLWTQKGADGKDQSLELNPGGKATTYDMSINYENWEVKDGLLLLRCPKKIGDESPAIVDTFHIMELTDESLVLMNGILTTEFIREN